MYLCFSVACDEEILRCLEVAVVLIVSKLRF